MRVYNTVSELEKLVGQELGTSEWVTVDQEKINLFAEVTGDQQWIHVDIERAAQGPFGGTIAHGYLTLSLVPALSATAYSIEGTRMAVNYGLNRVRFPAPLPAGSRVRGVFTLKEYTALPDNGAQLVIEATIEREGGDRPVCVAETVSRRYF